MPSLLSSRGGEERKKKEEKAYSLSSQEKYVFDVLPFDGAVFMSTINVPILFFSFRFFLISCK